MLQVHISDRVPVAATRPSALKPSQSFWPHTLPRTPPYLTRPHNLFSHHFQCPPHTPSPSPNPTCPHPHPHPSPTPNPKPLRHAEQLQRCELERALVSEQLEQLTVRFRQYQAAKASELLSLEEKIVGLITGGAKDAPQMVAAAAAAIRRSILALDPAAGNMLGGEVVQAGAEQGGARRGRNARRAGGAALGGGAAAATGGNRAGGRREGGVTGRAAAGVRRGIVVNGRGGAGSGAGARGGQGTGLDWQEAGFAALGAEVGSGLSGDSAAAAAAALRAVGPAPLAGAAAEVAAATGADGAAAARREALFERLQRQRAEALLGAARTSLARLKTRLKLTLRQAEAQREGCVVKVRGTTAAIGKTPQKNSCY